MTTNGTKGTRKNWTPKALAYVNQAGVVIDNLHTYWPLTLRQIYYQLVAALLIENNENEYKKLSRELTNARLDGFVDWDAMEDRSRTVLHSAGWCDKSHFVAQKISQFL